MFVMPDATAAGSFAATTYAGTTAGTTAGIIASTIAGTTTGIDSYIVRERCLQVLNKNLPR